MAWRRPGDKPLSEQMPFILTTHICVTRPQWVKLIILTTFRCFQWNPHRVMHGLLATDDYLSQCWLITTAGGHPGAISQKLFKSSIIALRYVWKLHIAESSRKTDTYWYIRTHPPHARINLCPHPTPRAIWPPFHRRYFHMHVREWKFCILIKISLKCVPKGTVDNNPAMV